MTAAAALFATGGLVSIAKAIYHGHPPLFLAAVLWLAVAVLYVYL